MTSPGWYNAEGDPPGTTRYWDGERWVGDPVHTPTSPGAGGYGGGTAGLRLASPGSRIGARLIDFVIAIIIAIVLLLPMINDVVDGIDALGPNPTNSQVQTVVENALEDNFGRFALLSVGGILWDFLWVAFAGGTPGKLMLGLRVARPDTGESPPGFGKAALRSLNRLIALIPSFGSLISLLIGLASLIMLFTDDQHRTVMDRIATTVVIKK